MPGIINALTIDVEDYFHVSAFEKSIDRRRWDECACRVAGNTRRLLALLDRHGVRATFFVLGWVGQRYPGLVREIHAAGHEVGSHGFWHRLIYRQSPEQFRDDLRQSLEVLEDAIGEAVVSHRAPSFSITRESLWALDILAEEGFRFDSSIVPARHDRYGIPGAEQGIHAVATSAGRLWQFPLPVTRIGRLQLPVGGGGYFRLYPLRWTVRWLQAINQRDRRPFVFYCHPWEIDPDQPRLRAGSRISRMRHYVNLASTERKLDALLQAFRFGRLCDVIEESTSVTNDKEPIGV